jgi:hypothetical protein
VLAPTQTGTILSIEEVAFAFRPVEWYRVKLGFFRIPFSIGQTIPIPKQMFPIRPAATLAFQNGADEGLLNTFAFLGSRIQANLGIYDGTSLGSFDPNQTVRGPVLGASLEAHPFGAMPLREGDPDRGSPKVALAAGTLYRSATAFDATGYEASTFKDTRLALSARASWYGAYLQGEFLRRVQSDSLSGRPIVATGGYGQASFYFPLKPVADIAFAPLFRYGGLTVDQDFAPRTFTSVEAGLAFYPRSDYAEPERLRVIAEYLGASVKPQNESEHEGLIQLQLMW